MEIPGEMSTTRFIEYFEECLNEGPELDDESMAKVLIMGRSIAWRLCKRLNRKIFGMPSKTYPPIRTNYNRLLGKLRRYGGNERIQLNDFAVALVALAAYPVLKQEELFPTFAVSNQHIHGLFIALARLDEQRTKPVSEKDMPSNLDKNTNPDSVVPTVSPGTSTGSR